MNRGDKVIVIHDWTGLEDPVTGVLESFPDKDDTVKVSGQYFYVAFVFPETARAEILAVLEKRRALKKAFDQSMELVYQLRNKYPVSRNEG